MSSKLGLKRCFTFLVTAFFMFASVYAQQLRISGRVTDASTNETLPGVNVAVKGSGTGTSTDGNGSYSISVNRGSVLVFSFLGYASQEFAVGNTTTINVALQPEATALNEVVVTALGIRKDVKRIGFSVQKIGNQEIAKVAPPTLAVGLMGKAAGVNVTQPNGVEGGSQRIVIRGNNSLLGNNQPLIIIDGIQMSDGHMGLNQSNGSGYNIRTGSFGTPDLGGTQTDWGSSLNFINNADIEDVNILKGPTAAALYGARGANGVILITTKKTGSKDGFGLEYNYSTRWNKAYLFQDYQNEYGYGGSSGMWSATDRLPKDADGNYRYPAEAPWSGAAMDNKYTQFGPLPGGYNFWDHFSWPGAGLSWGAKMEGQPVVWWDGKVRPYSPTEGAAQSFFRTGNTSSHNVAFSANGDFGGVRVSLNRTDNKAIIENSGFDQTSANVASNLNLSKKAKLEVVAGYTRYNRLNTPSIGDNNSVSKWLTYGFPSDYVPIEKDVYQNEDGSKNLFNNDKYPLTYPYSSYTNLMWHQYQQNTTLQRDQLIGSVKFSADPTPWLNLMARTGADYATNEFETKNTPIDAAGYQGQYGFEMNKDYTITAEALATAHKSNLFNGFDASLSVGTSTWYNRFVGTNAYNNGPFANPFLYYLSNTTATVNTNWLPTYYRLESKINSVFSLLDLSYNNYLFLQLTGRNDWSSTLPIDNCSYFYPSASLSFVFTEAFKMPTDVLSFGKIRMAYAGSANGTDPYKTQNIFASGVFGGVVTRQLPSTLQPTFLKPQRSSSFEIGTQLAFFNNRLSFDLTYYRIKSIDQILSGQLAWSTGVNSIIYNTGELQNQGVEFILRGTPVKTEDFEWNIGLNGAHNQNKVIALGEGIDKYYLGTIFGTRTGVSMYVEAGDNYGTIYGLDYSYLDGKKVVKQIWNSDRSKVVGTQYVVTKDPVPIGNATPFLTGGLSNSLRYKNLSLYILTDFKLGGDVYSMDYACAMGEGKAPETLLERNGGGLPYTYPDGTTANHGVILEGVFADGTPNTDVVHYMYKYAGQYQAWTNVDMPRSNAVFENTWVKLRELSLTYDIPSTIVQKTGVFQGLSVSLIGRDLFYIYKTLPDNMNPEGVSGIGNMQGMQWASLPGTRSIGFSIKAKF
jgi:iron complex outermembrane recepter protein